MKLVDFFCIPKTLTLIIINLIHANKGRFLGLNQVFNFKNSNTQYLKDLICLVFLNHYLDPFIQKHKEEKVISILQKTWKKMSKKGQKAALTLSFSDKESLLIKAALP